MKSPSVDDAIAALYSAAVDPSEWQRALTLVAGVADAQAANCFVHDLATDEFLDYRFIGYPEGFAQQYASHFHTLDLARQVLYREAPGRMHAMSRHLPDAVVARSEYYQDFYIPFGLRYSCGGTQVEGDRRLIIAVHRPAGHQPYDDATIARLQRVLDHLPNVFRIREATARAEHDTQLRQAALEALQRAVLIVDATLRVQYHNAAAQLLLDELREVAIRHGRLALTDSLQDQQLSRRVKDACQPRPLVGSSCLYLHGRDGRPNVELSVAPLRPKAVADGVARARPAAMVVLRRTFQAGEWPASAQRPFSLSNAEMAVARSLAEGLTPHEMAERSGIKISTVRTQIRSVLAKTGTRRVAEVAALFASMDMPAARGSEREPQHSTTH
jgi:DNA-binding CsgD family transcriptional regulator/PAS domain-containing protein